MTKTGFLDELIEQEERLVLPAFGADLAFELGCALRAAAKMAGNSVAIDITVNGRCLFSHAMEGTSADNAGWIARKRALVERFEHSSWYMKHYYESKGTTIEEKSLLSRADYGPFGGAFPLRVKGAGCIGVVTVSGLPQAEDHRLVVETLASFIAGNHQTDPLAEQK
ncbi:heme-degrading domain-containing protein [uncultured Cohaesibacter sp.]|uniref:heme-degrading domain-containing protein n=1 Tax=uncultured Cohaesibacter sp. TaxID=1002546 RepID=UPI0029C80624|nr:heme-degrading domain-containing protein [uncultured Cohaesibacter sp.]